MVNLYSDTQTRPTEGMRRAIATAEVGDEQRNADPTTQRLQERVAELLGQQAGLFLPSGTMCNQIAFRLHARPGGDELLLDRSAHPIIAEAGGAAQQAGFMINPIEGVGGIFTAAQLLTRAFVNAFSYSVAGNSGDASRKRSTIASRSFGSMKISQK